MHDDRANALPLALPVRGLPSRRRVLLLQVCQVASAHLGCRPSKWSWNSVARQAVVNAASATKIDALAQQLRDRLWQPLARYVKDSDALLIAPDGELCQLPFAALPGRAQGSCLLEQHAIGYVISGRQLLELRADGQQPSSAGLLAIGGLNYGQPKQSQAADGSDCEVQWSNLAGSQLEAEQVHRQFRRAFGESPAQLSTGEQPDAPTFAKWFTPGKLRQRYRYLHLATHGSFEEPAGNGRWTHLAAPGLLPLQREWHRYTAQPLLHCKLVFAGANADPARGLLTAQEITSLDLRGLDLAVLSACDTGLGAPQGGEGVQGLQQAFHLGGCRSPVANLWSIDDAATVLLMQEFYRNLWQKKLSKVEALRQAQLMLLRHPELLEKIQKALAQQLAKRGLPSHTNRRAQAALALTGLSAHAWGDVGPFNAALLIGAPLPGSVLRGPGSRLAQPLGGNGPPGQGRTHPAYWAAFVLSGDWR
jgi:CHAT domain-containing protein